MNDDDNPPSVASKPFSVHVGATSTSSEADDTLPPEAPPTIPAPPPSDCDASGVHFVERKWAYEDLFDWDALPPMPNTDMTMALDDEALDEE